MFRDEYFFWYHSVLNNIVNGSWLSSIISTVKTILQYFLVVLKLSLQNYLTKHMTSINVSIIKHIISIIIDIWKNIYFNLWSTWMYHVLQYFTTDKIQSNYDYSLIDKIILFCTFSNLLCKPATNKNGWRQFEVFVKWSNIFVWDICFILDIYFICLYFS